MTNCDRRVRHDPHVWGESNDIECLGYPMQWKSELPVNPDTQPDAEPTRAAVLTWLESPDIADVALALAKAQGQFKPVIKDTRNTFFGSNYAPLAGVLEAVREALSVNELAIVQQTMPPVPESREGSLMTVWTRLIHSSGQWLGSLYDVRPVVVRKDGGVTYPEDPQGVGSGLTYVRRYAASSILGLAPEDDDGNAASGRSGLDPYGNQGQGSPARQQGNQRPGNPDLTARFADRIGAATDPKVLAGIGSEIASDTTMGSGERASLRVQFDWRREFLATTKQPVAADTATAEDPAPKPKPAKGKPATEATP